MSTEQSDGPTNVRRVAPPEGSLGQVVLQAEEIATKVDELGARITADYASVVGDEPLVLVGVLKGAFVFLSDLVRRIDLPVEVEFMAV